VEQIADSTTTYLHHDQLGSIRLITDAAGSTTTATTQTWDPYGNQVSTTGSLTSPFGYAGEYTDPETSLQYDRARYYDPTTGQFLSSDPLDAVTRQPYSYANDNPLNFIDPTGEIPCSDFGPFSGACNTVSSVGGTVASGASTLAGGVASGASTIAGGVASGASAAWHFGTTHTIGFCVGGSVGLGIGVTGSVCVQGNLHSFGGTVTYGPVASTPAFGVWAGGSFSDAHYVCELGSYFDTTSVSGGVGVQGYGEVASGTLPNGRTVNVYSGGVAVAPPYIPVSASAGTTNTLTGSFNW
jgi:RHS repeat-associated protein